MFYAGVDPVEPLSDRLFRRVAVRKTFFDLVSRGSRNGGRGIVRRVPRDVNRTGATLFQKHRGRDLADRTSDFELVGR